MPALHGSLLVGCFLIIYLAIVCLLPTFLLVTGALRFHPPHCRLQHWTDIPPLVSPCLKYSCTVCSSFKLQSGENVAEPEGDMLNYASTYILTLIMANLLIYCIFYLAMKLISGERPTPWVKPS